MRTDDMFNRVMSKDNIALVCLFENRTTDSRLVVANAHLYWDTAFRDVKLLQAAMLIEEVDKVAARFARYPPKVPPPKPGAPHDADRPKPSPTYKEATEIPMLICGDWNSMPDSTIYDFFEHGQVSHDHEDFMDHEYGKYTAHGIHHYLHLRSAYPPEGKGEIEFTNFTPGFVGSIDHIWYSHNTLSVTNRLAGVDKEYTSKVVGFPNAHFPSE